MKTDTSERQASGNIVFADKTTDPTIIMMQRLDPENQNHVVNIETINPGFNGDGCFASVF
jgi:hypothetical protein